MPNSAACLIELVVSRPALARPMILGLGALRLQQERGKIRRIQGNADRTEHLAATRGDDLADVPFKRIAECIVRGQEEPAVATPLSPARRRCRPQARGCRMPSGSHKGVQASPVMREVAAPTTISIFFFSLEKLLDRQRHRRRRQFGDHVDIFVVVPAPRDAGGEIRLVLVVARDHLDLLAEQRCRQNPRSPSLRFDGIFSAVIRVDAGLVVENTDLDTLRGSRLGEQKTADRKQPPALSISSFVSPGNCCCPHDIHPAAGRSISVRQVAYQFAAGVLRAGRGSARPRTTM